MSGWLQGRSIAQEGMVKQKYSAHGSWEAVRGNGTKRKGPGARRSI